MIKTKRLNIFVATKEQMESFIGYQTDDMLKSAYTEMLNGCLKYPEQWEWYAIWMIELKDGTHIGELCFKGINSNGAVEIGYGVSDEHQGHGYATEAVEAVVAWALQQPNVTTIEAETEFENKASQRVLEKCGFVTNGVVGKEGPLFTLTR